MGTNGLPPAAAMVKGGLQIHDKAFLDDGADEEGPKGGVLRTLPDEEGPTANRGDDSSDKDGEVVQRTG